jgi:CheY-like chemotaxis protein
VSTYSSRGSASAVVESTGGRATALVVDGNATSRRFVELALAQSTFFTVEATSDAAGALEILKRQVVDLVISDTDLADQDGLALFRRLAHDQRLRSIPFIFFSSDRSIDAKVAALQAGVDDYLIKPCDSAELVARAKACLVRQRRLNDAVQTRAYELAGSLQALGFADLVSIIDMGRRSGVLSVVTGARSGSVHFKDGALVHATYGNLVGVAAFQRIFAEPTGHFEFTPGRCEVPDEAWTIDESTTGLIMEAARVFDTEVSLASPASPPMLETVRPKAADSSVPPALVPAPEGDVSVAAKLALGLEDPFTLGELRAWTRTELARTESEPDRFLVVLLADLREGVSALLALGGAPTEQWVVECLGPERKTLGLTFFLRHQKTVDVVLGDARAPRELLSALGRTPSVMLVCPPGGDLLSLGTTARVGLEELISSLEPPAIVGVGNRSLASGLVAMRCFQEGAGSAIRCVKGRLADGTSDLRSLLVDGFRVWASTGARTTVRPQRLTASGACS